MRKKREEGKKYMLSGHDDIGSMFELFSRMKHPIVCHSDNRWYPEVDVFETDTEFVVILDVAHIDPKDLDIYYKFKSLHIKGIRRELTDFKKRHYHKMEIDYGPFERKVAIPVTIDEQNIKTRYKDGFLQVCLKKIENRRQNERKIDIEWKDE